MWLTEEKANVKSCPIFSLAYYLTDDKLNDDACQGSRCAWWRFAAQPGVHGRKRVGYCGHAGKPEGEIPRIGDTEEEMIERIKGGRT